MGKLGLVCAAIGLLIGAAVGLDGHNENGAESLKAMSSITVRGEVGHEGRHLMKWTGNGYVYSTSSATYYLYGYVYDSQPTKPEEYPATFIEAEVNCTRMGLDQPNPDNPADVKAAQFLDANHRYAHIGTWIKTKPGGTCSWVTSTTITIDSGCNDGRTQYVCVKRIKSKQCGGKQCCSGASCCAGRICCQSGTACCPPTTKRKYAVCVEGQNKCPAT